MKNIGLTDRNFVHTVIRKPPEDVHKGRCGRILIAAGSREMAGAAVFAAKAAMKCGSGLVNVCTSRKIFPVLQISVPEAICRSWEGTKNGLAQFDAIAVGPGMGVGRRTKKILEKVLTEYRGTVIIDADGLNTIAADRSLQKLCRRSRANLIITPHIGEASRLLGKPAADLSKEEIGQALFRKLGAVAVVKGPGTLVAVSPETAYTNTTGNPGMATAGSGDVLTGIITSLAGQGLKPQDAARAGVFVHGLAGDLAAETLGCHGVTASDIADYVPFALKEITD